MPEAASRGSVIVTLPRQSVIRTRLLTGPNISRRPGYELET